MCVLSFSTTFVWNISYSKKNLTRYSQKCRNVFMKSTRYSCRILMKLNFLEIFEKNSDIDRVWYLIKALLLRRLTSVCPHYIQDRQYAYNVTLRRVDETHCWLGKAITWVLEEGRVLSDRAGNFGYPRLRDTVAAILQKADERSSPITENLLWADAILVKWVASSVQPLFYVLKKSKSSQVHGNSLTVHLLLYLS